MTLALNEEQGAIQDMVERYVRENYDFHRNRRAPPASREEYLGRWAEFADLGWLGLPFPESSGGLGLGLKETAILTAEFGQGLVQEPFITSVALAGRLLEQSDARSDLLDSLISGQLTCAVGHAEGNGYSALSSVATRAIKITGGYRLNGRKSLVYHAPWADRLILTVRTSGETTDRDGISLFVVDPQVPGLTLHGYGTLDNHTAADVWLDDVQVETGGLLGAEGGAYPVLLDCMTFAALCASAESAGIARALVKATKSYLAERKQFGQPLATFQALQHRLADLYMDAEEASAFTAVAIEAYEHGDSARAQQLAADCKARVDRLCVGIAHAAIQLHGGMGFTDELIISHYAKRVQALGRRFSLADFGLPGLEAARVGA